MTKTAEAKPSSPTQLHGDQALTQVTDDVTEVPPEAVATSPPLPKQLFGPATAEGKTCRRCREFKPITELKRDGRNSDNYSSFCKSCHRESSVAWQKANPEKVKAAWDKRYARTKDQYNVRRKERYDPERVRWAGLRRFYKMTREEYEALAKQQRGLCAICDEPPKARPLVVDHDHSCCIKTPTCGKCNRGLLCNSCNLSLSALERRDGWMDRAVHYLDSRRVVTQ